MKVRDEQMETNDKKRVSFSNSEKYCNKKNLFFFTLIVPFFLLWDRKFAGSGVHEIINMNKHDNP